MERFREGLLTIIYILGRILVRSIEIIGIRYSNIANGGVRNIIIDRGIAYFITSYYKNYRNSGQVKVIYRYLLREAGELLV